MSRQIAVRDRWEPIDPFRAISRPFFVSGDADDDRLRVAYFRRNEDDALLATVWFGSKAEGPPHHAHGGSIAAVLDEAMGASAWICGSHRRRCALDGHLPSSSSSRHRRGHQFANHQKRRKKDLGTRLPGGFPRQCLRRSTRIVHFNARCTFGKRLSADKAARAEMILCPLRESHP